MFVVLVFQLVYCVLSVHCSMAFYVLVFCFFVVVFFFLQIELYNFIYSSWFCNFVVALSICSSHLSYSFLAYFALFLSVFLMSLIYVTYVYRCNGSVFIASAKAN